MSVPASFRPPTAAGALDVPDRSHVATEWRNPRSEGLHELSVEGLVALMNAEDRLVAEAVGRAAGAIAGFIGAAEGRFCDGGRLVYLGAGTSGRLGVLDASECPPTFQTEPGRVVGIIAGGDAALRRSSEGMEDDPDGAAAELGGLGLTGKDTVLGIAAGGTTPYVLGGLRHAKRLAPGGVTGLLVCAPIERPAWVDHLIVVETGPEVLTGSTRLKAGTATKMVLNMVSTALMVRSGRVYGNLMVDVRATNAKLRDRAARIVAAVTGLTREESLAALERAGGAAKTAIVMVKMGLTREEAEAALARCGGRLERALGE